MRVTRFYQSDAWGGPPPPRPPCASVSPAADRSGNCRTASASSRSQWALRDFICQLQIAVGTAGPQQRAPDPSGQRRTSTASSRSQWATPDLTGELPIPVGMFWHVYFFRRICQACASLWTCFGMFISSAHLSGMRSSLDMFWHVYFFNCICQVCAALWTCFGMFISPVEPARHVLLLTVFSHLCCQVALTQR